MNEHANHPTGVDSGLEHGVFETGRAAQRLRIYIGEADRWKGRPLYESIVREARQVHLAGATVFRSPLGFGAKSRVHTARILRLSEDLPIVVEIVDSPARIAEFVPRLHEMVKDGLVTIEDVGVLVYSPGDAPSGE